MTVYIVNELSYLAAKIAGEISGDLAQLGVDLISSDCEQLAETRECGATVIYVQNSSQSDSWKPLQDILDRLGNNRIIVVASHYDEQELRLSLAKGAYAYVAKSPSLSENVKSAIEVVQSGGFFLGDKTDVVAKLNPVEFDIPVNDESAFARSGRVFDLNKPGVTPRQKDVAEKLLNGMSNKEIADELSIEVGTVKVHVRALYKKFNISSRFQFYRLMEVSTPSSSLQYS